jgi:hypothetical protein
MMTNKLCLRKTFFFLWVKISFPPILQNAFSYGSARPALSFHWQVSNQEIGDVVSVFHKNGVVNTNSGVVR